MKRTRVVSSSVTAVGHDEGTRTLEVEFADGRAYRHLDVPTHVPAAMLGGTVSVGRYFIDNVRGVYRYVRL